MIRSKLIKTKNQKTLQIEDNGRMTFITLRFDSGKIFIDQTVERGETNSVELELEDVEDMYSILVLGEEH